MAAFICILLFLLVAAIDLRFALLSLQHKEKKNTYLALSMFGSASVCISYMISMLCETRLGAAVWSSVYYLSVTFTLLMLLFYVAHFTEIPAKGQTRKTIETVFSTLACVDTLLLLVNPFTETSVSFTYLSSSIAPWRYEIHPLYYYHLTLCYFLILAAFLLLLLKIYRTPRIYQFHYANIILGVLLLVIMNAIFLYLPAKGLFDFSILFYSLVAMLLYANNFLYPEKVLPFTLRTALFVQTDLPMVMFDYSNCLVTSNERAAQLIPAELLKKDTTLDRFTSGMNFDSHILQQSDNVSFLWNDSENHVFRCESRSLNDKGGEYIGRVFIFNENSPEYDLLTGFHSKYDFRRRFSGAPEFPLPIGAALFDLNRLAEMNDTCGRNQGDRAIQFLAELIRSYAPEGSYFARLSDANLICICPSTDLDSMRSTAECIRQDMIAKEFFGFYMDVQSTCACITEEGKSLLDVEKELIQSLRTRKMLDHRSAHTSLLDSLAQVQQENDSETEHHVQRTQILCNQLGLRLGLSDKELSDLSLLALMHDVGKLGIPIEVLNKPGRLSPEEWTVMKTHVERGYRIAKVSPELSGISEMILHHHESWDGSGYPDRLMGEQIPLLSRVIAVVDAFDAMTNDRPYRAALPVSSACAELRRCRGTQFDAHIVDAFTAMLGENETSATAVAPVPTAYGVSSPSSEPVTEITGTVSTLNYTHYLLDSNNTILQADSNFEVLTGYSEEDIRGGKLTQQDLIVMDDLPAYLDAVRNSIALNHEAFLEHRMLRKDGSLSYVVCYGRQFFDPVSRSMRNEIVASDVANLFAAQMLANRDHENARQVISLWSGTRRRDELTWLLTDDAFKNDAAIRILDSHRRTLLLLIDIDDFTGYSERNGRQKADTLLIEFSKLLRRFTRGDDLTARIEKDMFAAAVSFPAYISDSVITDRIRDFRQQFTADLQHYDSSIRFSLGFAYTGQTSTNYPQLFSAAMQTLNENSTDLKQNGPI